MFRIATKCFAVGLATFLIATGGRTMSAQSPGPVRIEKGTRLVLDLDTHLNSGMTREGDTVLFRARNDTRADGRVAIPRGTLIKGTVTQVDPAFVNGKPQKAEMKIRLDEISLNNGSVLLLKANEVALKAETAGRSVTGTVMQGSVGPAMMGGMMGGLIGGSARASGIGAVAAIGISAIGASRQPRMRGSEVDLPREAIVETRLEVALDIADPTLLAALPAPAAPLSLPSDASTGSVAYASVAYHPGPDRSLPADLPRADEPATTVALPASVGSVATPRDTAVDTGAFSISLDVNRVLIDAVVRDRAGNPLTNLRKEDFRLFEDGVEKEVRDFSRDELPLAVALVVDRSGSVAPLLNRVQTAAFQALQQLKSEDEVCLISFAADVELLEPLTADRARVASRIGTIRAGGGTAIVDAIGEAFRYLAQTAPDRRRAVILISDNVEGRSHTNLTQVMELASETDAVVYSVRIGQASTTVLPGLPIPGRVTPVLQAPTPAFDPVPIITRETGGEVFTTGMTTVDAAMATAISRLKSRYTLSFAPVSNSTHSFHRVEVRLIDRFGKYGSDYTVLSRGGYFGGTGRTAGN